MTKSTTQILENMTRDKVARSKRKTLLLKEPEEEFTTNWFMKLPKSFNDALDIKQTDRKNAGLSS